MIYMNCSGTTAYSHPSSMLTDTVIKQTEQTSLLGNNSAKDVTKQVCDLFRTYNFGSGNSGELIANFKSCFQGGANVKTISEELSNEASRRSDDARWIFNMIISLDCAGFLIAPFFLKVLTYSRKEDMLQLRHEMNNWAYYKGTLGSIVTAILAFHSVGQITFYELPILEKVLAESRRQRPYFEDSSETDKKINELEDIVKELKNHSEHKLKKD